MTGGDRVACQLYLPAQRLSWAQCFIDRAWGAAPVIPEVHCLGIPSRCVKPATVREQALHEIDQARRRPVSFLIKAARRTS